MKVLIACEYSGRIREAFAALGHDAWSCDLLPTEQPGQHIQGDVRPLLQQPWDLVVAHPPCTHLANSGARWPKPDDVVAEAVRFFKDCLSANAPRVAVENPVMNRKRTGIRKPDFSVQPWQFGDPYAKRTCFWTRNLQPLAPTHERPEVIEHAVHKASPGPDRWKDRSRTYPGLARAIAHQWGQA